MIRFRVNLNNAVQISDVLDFNTKLVTVTQSLGLARLAPKRTRLLTVWDCFNDFLQLGSHQTR